MKNTSKLTLSAIMAALSVVLLLLGTVTVVLEFVMLAVSSFLVLFILMAADKRFAWLFYAAVSLLSLLLLPDKGTAFLYAAFCGIYPLFKFRLDKFAPLLQWSLKYLWINAAAAGLLLLWRFVFLVPDGDYALPILLFGFVLLNLTFYLYDKALRRFVRTYFDKIEPRLRFLK